jgi:hypothetical protein
MSAPQLELFERRNAGPTEATSFGLENPPPDFIARIRDELQATLVRVQQATALPWADLTQATLAELRFKSISAWLPDPEAASLREAFEAEMTRLYECEDGQSGEK